MAITRDLEPGKEHPLHVAGVDGGTSKTIALVADDTGRILGAARGPGSNATGPDVDAPMAVVAATVREAMGQAGLSGQAVDMAVLGLAGADWPEDYARRQNALERAGFARRLAVKNDAMVGLRAGTRQPFGVVIAAGTGTNTGAIAPDGREYLFGYYARSGGAWGIADEAVNAVLRQEDGRGRPTALTDMVLQRLGFPSPEALLRAMVAGALGRANILGVCPLVFEAAEVGDKVAVDILTRQATILSEYAAAVIHRFGMQELEFSVVLSGSVFKGRGALFVDTIRRALREVAPRARIVRAGYEPAVGGLLLAYDALGVETGEKVHANLARTVPGPGFFDTSGMQREDGRNAS